MNDHLCQNSTSPEELPWEWDDRTPIEMDDEELWDALLPDEGQVDPLPEPGDFWIDSDGAEDSMAEELTALGAN